MQIVFESGKQKFSHQVFLITDIQHLNKAHLSPAIVATAKKNFEGKNCTFLTFDGTASLHIVLIDHTLPHYIQSEKSRNFAFQIVKFLNANKAAEMYFENLSADESLAAAFAEGALLSSYQFLKYKTKDFCVNTLKKIIVSEKTLTKKTAQKISVVCEANLIARDLVNEPLSFLTATQLSKEVEKIAKAGGVKCTILDKKKIAALKMGGLLAVNRGSQDPPTFTVLEYKPAKPKNKQPIVLVGKGVVFDTGGLSLKPTPNSMDMMKCDMAGAAVVAGVFHAVAKLKLPLHIVGLIPATDNRPGENAYVPGDVVKMMNGMTVEVLNTDAEGRMILADALTYAANYKPSLVCDFATLTGAAKAAIGSQGTVYMGTANDDVKKSIVESGKETYERQVEFPFWDEYGKMIKSDVADIKNTGGSEAGMITAGKFLECFTSYPWLHFDIAGPAYLMAEDSYRGKYGTGVGVRMIIEFLSRQ